MVKDLDKIIGTSRVFVKGEIAVVKIEIEKYFEQTAN